MVAGVISARFSESFFNQRLNRVHTISGLGDVNLYHVSVLWLSAILLYLLIFL